jgi:fructokinase
MAQGLISDGRPVIFGEVLYDSFPDGDVLGGAPFNVAWHLQGFGMQPLFISRIGRDARGEHILHTMERWGMDRAGVQVDDRHPTGTVQVTLNEQGQPTFDILPDQAYDFIAADAEAPVLDVSAPPLLYRGTLATRHGRSRDTLQALTERLGVPVFVDVNLRPPWWQREAVERGLEQARWAKLNDEELAIVADRPLTPDELPDAGEQLRERCGLDLLVLTTGASGAWFVRAGGRQHGTPPPLERMADTVGAGDAFSAVTILGLLRGWPPQQTLDRSLAFAAAICGQRGATAANRALYDRFLAQWNEG